MVGFGALLWLFAVSLVGPSWLIARRAGMPISMTDLIGMRLRRTPVRQVIEAAAAARKAGIDVSISQIEVHYLCGGDGRTLVDACVALRRAGKPADWSSLVACDLAGRDVMAIIAAGVDPGKVVGSKQYGDRFRKHDSTLPRG